MNLKPELMLPVIVIALAFVLAISPNIFLEGQNDSVSSITREDITTAQLNAIVDLSPATMPSDVANGATAIRDISQAESGELIISGSFEDEVEFGDFKLISKGSRDIYIGLLGIDGNWSWIISGGGVGFDDVVDIELGDNSIQVVGWGHGNLSFGDREVRMLSKYGKDAWQTDISLTGELNAAWRIDPILLPQMGSSLWCGFR